MEQVRVVQSLRVRLHPTLRVLGPGLVAACVGCVEPTIVELPPDTDTGAGGSDSSGDATGVGVTSGPDTGGGDGGAGSSSSDADPTTGASGPGSTSTGDTGADPTGGTVDCEQSELPAEGLVVWLDADHGVEMAGDRVTRWENRGSGSDFASAGNDPVFVEDVLAGNPVIRFDGNGQRLEAGIDINGTQGLSFVLVSATRRLWYPGPEWCQDFDLQEYEQGCSGSYNTQFMWGESGSWGFTGLGAGQEWVSFRFGTGQKAYSELETDPEVRDLLYDPNLVWKRPESIGDAFETTVAVEDGSTMWLYLDGDLALERGLPGGGGAISAASSDLLVGGGRHDRWWGGDIALLLIYDHALDDDEKVAVDAYTQCRFFEVDGG